MSICEAYLKNMKAVYVITLILLIATISGFMFLKKEASSTCDQKQIPDLKNLENGNQNRVYYDYCEFESSGRLKEVDINGDS